MKFEQKCHILNDRIKETKKREKLCFVLCDKFWSALRNSINIIPDIRPDIIIAERWGYFTKSDFILEEWGVIGDTHYCTWKDWINWELIKRAENQRVKFFSWTPKQQLLNIGEFLCPESSARDFIEDKTNLKFILSNAGIDVEAFTLRHDNFESTDCISEFQLLAEKYWLPFVMQWTSKWWDGTIIVRTVEDFEKRIGLVGKIRISEFCNKQYSSIYACTIPSNEKHADAKVVMDRPAFKVVGVSSHGIPEVLGGGCNWWQVPNIDPWETIQNVKKIWVYLSKKFWYKWSFVLEWFFINGRFVFNELNARLGWGNEVSGFNQVRHWEIPIQAIHYALQLGIYCHDLLDEHEFHQKHFDTSRGWCFYFKLLGKNRADFRVGSLNNGTYSFQSNLIHMSDEIDPHKVGIEDKGFVISNLPRTSTLCRGDSHICMVEGISHPADELITWPRDVNGLVLQISDLVYNSLVYEQR